MIKGKICPECLRDLDQEYIEEGDHRLCIEPIKCPYCGWQLWDGWIKEELEHPTSVIENSAEPDDKCT